ncbi:hypothetical protein Tco_0974522 [Tanacetum coccineum]|uniref:Reverse transcriptase Ty1/copia-type domain-containing protein n=1 Tax=Tanacetum coccineum TaxID=301880 RepID=A0ABQ5EBT5_9ASTR
MKTPMSSDTKLTKDEECESVDSTKYRGMIGSLLYLTASMPDIMFSVCLCARFQEAPKTSHLEVNGPYQPSPPSLEEHHFRLFENDREVKSDSNPHADEFDSFEYQGGNRDHVPVCLCYMLYCVVHSEKFNLAYFMAKRMEWVTKQKRLILPYGMLLTRLFKVIMNENPELNNESYVLYDRVMNPLAAQQERKPRKDHGTRRGRHSTSSSSAFDQPSSSHLNDDDDGNGEGTSRASTPSPIRYVNSLTNQVPQVFQNPPNIDPHLEPFYTRQTEIINHQV